jgi:beta-galactosidase
VTDPAEYGKDLYRSQWSFTNGIHSWTWEGQQGKETLAEVFSNAEEAELYINGQSQGRLQAEKQERKNYYSWICRYTPGTIEVITYKNHNEIGRDMIQTVKSGSLKIQIEPERLESDLKDSAYVILNIMLKDEAGTLDMSHDLSLKICVEGDGKLLAFGSANPCTEAGYDGNVCKMYHGRAQAILLKKVPGTVEVRVTSEGLPESSITV